MPTPLSLAVDVREACRPRMTGKGRWTHGFVSELLRRPEVRLTLLTDLAAPPEWTRPDTDVQILRRRGFSWHLAAARSLGSMPNLAAYLSPTSYIVPAMPGRLPRIPVVHDLIAFRDEPHDRRARSIERLTLGRAVKRAPLVLTVSDATKADLLKRYPKLPPSRVTAVYAGPLRSDPPPPRPDGFTVLCVATLCPRKNQERLIRAFSSLPEAVRSKHQLVLAGARGWDDDGIVALAASTPGVEWKDYIDDAQYEKLMNTCTVLALPSLYEGFGMQVLDGMQRGVPVLVSDRGSLGEIARDAACVVDPESVESIRDGLLRLLTDAGYRSSLIVRGSRRAERYTWARSVDLFLQGLQGAGIVSAL